jgi:hypothetical protein
MATPTKTELSGFKKLTKSLRAVRHGTTRATPPTLYHYTTSPGLLGIISSGYLRATNFSFLNDSSEVRYGLELVMSRFDAESREREENDRISLILGVAGRVWMEEVANLANTYVACFTEARDDLNQWRGYGGAADRYCVGFDTTALASRVAHSFGPVVYDRKEQVAVIDEYFAEANRVLRQLRRRPTEWLLVSAMKTLCQVMMEWTSFFKDPHFSSELEWRAVRNIQATSNSELEFDISGTSLRPFLRVFGKESERLPISEIVVQSARRDERARKAVELLLSRCGYGETPVIESEVPFRVS